MRGGGEREERPCVDWHRGKLSLTSGNEQSYMYVHPVVSQYRKKKRYDRHETCLRSQLLRMSSSVLIFLIGRKKS